MGFIFNLEDNNKRYLRRWDDIIDYDDADVLAEIGRYILVQEDKGKYGYTHSIYRSFGTDTTHYTMLTNAGHFDDAHKYKDVKQSPAYKWFRDMVYQWKKDNDDLAEDIDSSETTPITELCEAIADKLGDSIVINNCIYFIQDDFETWDTEKKDYKDVERGIFFIIEVTENAITVYNAKEDVISDLDSIGKEPLSYFATDAQHVVTVSSVKSLVSFLNRYFGSEWFASRENTEEFLDDFGGVVNDKD